MRTKIEGIHMCSVAHDFLLEDRVDLSNKLQSQGAECYTALIRDDQNAESRGVQFRDCLRNPGQNPEFVLRRYVSPFTQLLVDYTVTIEKDRGNANGDRGIG